MTTRFTATFTALAVATLALPSSTQAGDREWAVAGKVLTGIAAAHVISRAFEPAPVVYYQAPAPTYVQYQPAPVFVPGSCVAPAAPICAPTTAVVYQTAPVVYVQARAPICVPPTPIVVNSCGYTSRPYIDGRRFHGRRHW